MVNKLILALPKGRILQELAPLFKKCNIQPETDFFDENSRKLRFRTNKDDLDLIKVRSFDVASFVDFGAAAFGIAGLDVLMEYGGNEIYAPLDLKIAKCRLVVAEEKNLAKKDDASKWTHIAIATKYPNLTKHYFSQKGIQAECIKLNGAVELAPSLGLCQRIVDLVSTGKTLKENGLVEIEKIADISSYLIVNRTYLKTCSEQINAYVHKFKEAING